MRWCAISAAANRLGWAFQWTMIAAVAVALVLLWRSRVRYSLKAAALATGTLLVTPYLFLYDVMVLAIAVGFLVRIGLSDGFRRYELPALGVMAFLLMFYPLFGAPTGFAATLIVAALIAGRCLMPRTRRASRRRIGIDRSTSDDVQTLAARAQLPDRRRPMNACQAF